MKDSKMESCSMLISGLILLLLGICVMITRDTFIFTVIELIASLLVLAGVVQLVILVVRKKENRKYISLTNALISIVLGELIQLFPGIQVSIIVILFGIYAILMGAIKMITFYIYRKDHVRGRSILFIDALLFLSVGMAMVLTPTARVGQLFFVIGLYAASLGYIYIRDGLEMIIPHSYKHFFKRLIRVNLPIFLVALLPYRALQAINKYLGEDEDSDVVEFVEKKSEQKPELEVFIHVTKKGYGVLGHVDLCFNGEVISYGNYDHQSYRLNETIGDGILFTTSKEKYIPFCKEHSQKTLFGYGLKLDQEQYKNVENRINEIKSRLIEWKPPALEDPQHMDMYNDYASLLVKETGAKTYKFKNSRFKTYFVLSTNCVLLADSVIGKAGTDLLNINGIITPGTYYDYFEKEFKKKDSFVVTRTLYK